MNHSSIFTCTSTLKNLIKQCNNKPIAKLVTSKRQFFASSTDHTKLLSNAKVHCISQEGETDNSKHYAKRQYILLPNDISLDLALKVDKLHLARLSANRNMIHGAKVVQRSLGIESNVCMPLLNQARKDAVANGECLNALASLDGLSKWVSTAMEEYEEIESTRSDQTSDVDKYDILEILSKWKLDDQEMYDAVKAIATGIPRPGHSVVGQGTYRDGEQGWKVLAALYVKKGLSPEALLYEKGGGELNSIEHLADTSREGLKYCGGAMARYIFQS